MVVGWCERRLRGCSHAVLATYNSELALVALKTERDVGAHQKYFVDMQPAQQQQ